MRDDLCRILRNRIVELEYNPGDSLNEKKIAAELGVSRTPIREALIILAAENLVVLSPNSGARVTDINLKDFQELISFRIILERGVGRLSALNATTEDIQALEQLHSKILGLGPNDLFALMDCDTNLHQIIRRASRNPLLDKQLEIAQNQFTRIQKLISHRPDRMTTDLLQVIEALKQKNGDKMERLMVEHVEHFVSVVRKYFKMTPS